MNNSEMSGKKETESAIGCFMFMGADIGIFYPAATQASLPGGVFDDWYFPSKYKLDLMPANLHV